MQNLKNKKMSNTKLIQTNKNNKSGLNAEIPLAA